VPFRAKLSRPLNPFYFPAFYPFLPICAVSGAISYTLLLYPSGGWFDAHYTSLPFVVPQTLFPNITLRPPTPEVPFPGARPPSWRAFTFLTAFPLAPSVESSAFPHLFAFKHAAIPSVGQEISLLFTRVLQIFFRRAGCDTTVLAFLPFSSSAFLFTISQSDPGLRLPIACFAPHDQGCSLLFLVSRFPSSAFYSFTPAATWLPASLLTIAGHVCPLEWPHRTQKGRTQSYISWRGTVGQDTKALLTLAL